VKGFKDIEDKLGSEVHDRFGETRVWTDDCSMALAIADSLHLNKFQFEPIHVRYMFTLWLRHGLDNGGRESSIGLGGNISISMS
jgi:ADP-ribosylglycohydrolase